MFPNNKLVKKALIELEEQKYSKESTNRARRAEVSELEEGDALLL